MFFLNVEYLKYISFFIANGQSVHASTLKRRDHFETRSNERFESNKFCSTLSINLQRIHWHPFQFGALNKNRDGRWYRAKLEMRKNF